MKIFAITSWDQIFQNFPTVDEIETLEEMFPTHIPVAKNLNSVRNPKKERTTKIKQFSSKQIRSKEKKTYKSQFYTYLISIEKWEIIKPILLKTLQPFPKKEKLVTAIRTPRKNEVQIRIKSRAISLIPELKNGMRKVAA